jgi:hypothetical protein
MYVKKEPIRQKESCLTNLFIKTKETGDRNQVQSKKCYFYLD